MHINPALTALENILQLVSDPSLGQPVNPTYLAATNPTAYVPSSADSFNVDGVNSNTQVIVFLRPSLEDVSEDGVNQKIAYQRKTLAQAVGATPLNVALHASQTPQAMLNAIATQLGLIAEELLFTAPFTGTPATLHVTPILSLVYLPSTLTLNATYS